MRLNWLVDPTYTLNEVNIREGAEAFFNKHGVVPETMKMSFRDMNTFLSMIVRHSGPVFLEKGKEYVQYIPIPGGMLELGILEEDQEFTAHSMNPHNHINPSGQLPLVMVFESTKIDREFEKHILKG